MDTATVHPGPRGDPAGAEPRDALLGEFLDGRGEDAVVDAGVAGTAAPGPGGGNLAHGCILFVYHPGTRMEGTTVSTLYEATATAWGGRDGRVSSSDDRVDLNLSIPKGMGGDDGPGTNPEQLFAAGYAACFHSALKAIARSQKVDVADSACP